MSKSPYRVASREDAYVIIDESGNDLDCHYIIERLDAANEMRTLLGRSLRLIEIFPFPSESDKQLIRAIQDCLHTS